MNNTIYRDVPTDSDRMPDYDQGEYFAAREDNFGAWAVYPKTGFPSPVCGRLQHFWDVRMLEIRSEACSELFDRVPPDMAHHAVHLADNLFIHFGLGDKNLRRLKPPLQYMRKGG